MSDQRTTRAERPSRPREDGESPRRRPQTDDGGDRRPEHRDGAERRRPQDRNDEGERRRPQDRNDEGERRRPQDRNDDGERRRPQDRNDDGDRPARSSREQRPLDAVGASRLALDALQQLTSKPTEGVIGVERDDEGGWVVVVELLETSRIPNTSDVLGEYEVEIAPDRSLRSYTRRARYTRGSTMSD